MEQLVDAYRAGNVAEFFRSMAPAPAPILVLNPVTTINSVMLNDVTEIKAEVPGLKWFTPSGFPFVAEHGGKCFPLRYDYEGVLWSGRGRMPAAVDKWVEECKGWGKTRAVALAEIEEVMLSRGYTRV
ncbi:MAG: hypothetical protein PHE17_07360 [Thiothrix sp.]|uniref:hypothetical protein n=1 Tax=Thiothrix sp. TaxID=1032 RepID=UPI00261E4790|nr:hypothetical protein [Thiothrix sp.]MDD5392822.1 hypothetical protein [Thiothrix sp.]